MNPDIKRKRTTTTTTESDRLFPAYCSPEVIEGELLTAKSDMWGLGILLFQAISSMKHPFEGESQWDLINKILTQDKPKNLSNSISPYIKEIILCLLEKNPD